MGHALNNTLQDILVRLHRMMGDNTLWMPGTDHAGIATQTVVEKRVLAEEGRRRTDFAREEFVAKIQAWKDEYEARILGQLKAMGCSCDWDRTRFTMDEVCARAVREAFFRLFKDGLIYRGKRLVNWDPATQTALADDEVEMQDIDGHFWYLQYPLVEPVTVGEETIGHVTVATTRPETMLGDTGVAVNPQDPRAKALVGKEVRLPIVDRIIPIVEDDYVTPADPDSEDAKAQFSTGFLKVTPAHDPNDWEIGQRHGLPIVNVLGPDGTVSDQYGWDDVGGADFTLGLDRYEAREAIVEWFRENNLLEEVRPYRHSVGHSYRSHVPIEPYLSDQWYVKVTDDRLAGAALRAMAPDQRAQSDGCVWKETGSFESQGDGWEGGLRFHPDRYARTFQAWHENLRDWCISRQLWWGHRIPVWSREVQIPAGIDPAAGPERDMNVLNSVLEADFDAVCREGEVRYVHQAGDIPDQPGWILTHICLDHDQSDVISLLEGGGWRRDPDVLDTWFSSALWPFSTMGWPEETAELARWNPTNVLCTAREIITLWVSRMVMTNTYFLNRLPFTDVYIHAMLQDGEGRKMSKSLGNGIEPLDIIEKYGADAMRYSLTYLCTGMQDIRMPVKQETLADGRTIKTSERFEIGRNLCNKLWNASRLVLTNLEGAAEPTPLSFADLPREDRWILSRLNTCVGQMTDALTGYRFDDAAIALYRFFWNDFCDWYLEWIKGRLYGEGGKGTAQQVSAFCLDRILRLAAPFMPYITEKLWGELNRRYPVRGLDSPERCDRALVVSAWPGRVEAFDDAVADREMDLLQQIIRGLRDVRATVNRSRAANKEKSIGKLPLANVRCDEGSARLIGGAGETVRQLAGLDDLRINPDAFTITGCSSRMIGEVELAVPIGELIDVDQERARLDKEIGQLEKHIKGSESRLANPKFTEKAPPQVVAEHRQTLEDLKTKLTGLQQARAELH